MGLERYGGHLTATAPDAVARFTVWLRCEPLG